MRVKTQNTLIDFEGIRGWSRFYHLPAVWFEPGVEGPAQGATSDGCL